MVATIWMGLNRGGDKGSEPEAMKNVSVIIIIIIKSL